MVGRGLSPEVFGHWRDWKGIELRWRCGWAWKEDTVRTASAADEGCKQIFTGSCQPNKSDEEMGVGREWVRVVENLNTKKEDGSKKQRL